MKARGLDSPDDGDALALTFAAAVRKKPDSGGAGRGAGRRADRVDGMTWPKGLLTTPRLYESAAFATLARIMQGPFRTPELLAQALLRGPVTPERIGKLLRHAKQGTRAEFAQTLAAIAEADTRTQVEQAAASVRFAG